MISFQIAREIPGSTVCLNFRDIIKKPLLGAHSQTYVPLCLGFRHGQRRKPRRNGPRGDFGAAAAGDGANPSGKTKGNALHGRKERRQNQAVGLAVRGVLRRDALQHFPRLHQERMVSMCYQLRLKHFALGLIGLLG